jgi:hypothetical protein
MAFGYPQPVSTRPQLRGAGIYDIAVTAETEGLEKSRRIQRLGEGTKVSPWFLSPKMSYMMRWKMTFGYDHRDI